MIRAVVRAAIALQCVLVGVLVAACSAPVDLDGPPATATTDAESDTPPAEPPAITRVDPHATEQELLALHEADVGDDELLSLPGSQGFAIMDDSRGAVAVSDGATSIGTPHTGTIASAIQLPFDPTRYTRRDAKRSYATSQTVRTIQAAFTSLRRDRGVKAEVLIGDISLPRGGSFSPHVSHTSGRDIDIRLVLARGLDRETIPFLAEQVDWDATWALVHSFLETGDVAYVFLDWGHQAHLHRAALRAGVHEQVLDRWFQWPAGYDATSIIRHEPGHRAHLHVRLGCAGQGPRCVGGLADGE